MLIATAALFLAAKSKKTPRYLKNILMVSCEILHKQDITLLSYMLPVVSIKLLSTCLLRLNLILAGYHFD
ncbi:hypothetical protein Tsubulata_017650, partial [Turnera subulata]